jgi:hypothetical protein
MKTKYVYLLLFLLLCGNLEAEIGYADSPSGTLTSLPPEAPVLLIPVSGTINAPLNVELSWVKLLHAASYLLQVSTLPDFSVLTIDQAGLTEIHHTASGLLHQTLYYWRIQGGNRAGSSQFSPVWSFTTVPALPTAPAPSMPADSSTTVSVDPFFAWNAVANADTYHLQGSTLIDFSTITFEKTDVTGTWYQHQGLAPGTVYFWRVSAINAGGESPWSEIWHFITTWPTSAENKREGELPTDFALSPAYPNPFNGGTVINWQLPVGTEISLRIYNVAGRLVREPASGYHEGGRYSFAWDGRDAFGELVGSGLYFCRFEAEGRVFMQKLSLIR